MSRLAGGQSALIARQKAGAAPAGPITYTRIAGGEITLTGLAWVGNTRFSRLPAGGVDGPAVVHGDRDYLIPADALVYGGSAFLPARGDRITETIGGSAVTFEVMSLPGEPEWRYSDPGRTLLRVHVKEVQ